MRYIGLLYIMAIFTFISCDSDEDYILDSIENEENVSELLHVLNNSKANICSVSDKYDVQDFSLYMKQSASGSVQGAACYGDYMFQFQHGLQNVFIYNLKTKKFVRKLEYDLQNSYHCNNANFSTQFYSPEDIFPLLYVSQQSNDVHQTLVYRLVGDSIENINLNLIQTIVGPTPTSENHMYYQDCIIDADKGYFYLYALHQCEEFESSLYIVRYKLPDFSESLIRLKDEDIYGSVFFDKKKSSLQGAICKDGLIYIVKGVPDWKEQVYLDIIDFDKKEVCYINLTEKGFRIEPEGLCFYGNNLLCATNRAGIYNFHIVEN